MRLQDLCQQYNIRFKKQLGQNLLLDDNINRIMVDAAGLTPEIDVVEVGAGLGALTRYLMEQSRRVLAIEIDKSFLPALEDQFGKTGNVVLLRADVLNHRIKKLVNEYLPDAQRFTMVSNLPYYITTPLLFHFWESEVFFERMVVMVQEEVGHRMNARVGDSEYGMLAVAAQLRSEVDIVHKVPASCFRPQPKVDSCIVRLRNRMEPLYADVDDRLILRIARAAFAQRRKTLRNTLTRDPKLGIPGDEVLSVMETIGLDPSRRPQTLSLDDFAELARAVAARKHAIEAAGKA